MQDSQARPIAQRRSSLAPRTVGSAGGAHRAAGLGEGASGVGDGDGEGGVGAVEGVGGVGAVRA